ncbi:MAG: sugar phosphate isomerase/epimerase family protein [Gemmataceae bacterium]
MLSQYSSYSRREFLHTLTAAGLAASLPAYSGGQDKAQPRLALGIDNFAVRAMGWKGQQLVDYAASLEVDSLFITDLDGFGGLADGHLRDLRQRAADKGLAIQAGTWSICPTSLSFRKDWGTAEEHLALGIRVAQAVGSPIIRVILGSRRDRLTEGGIDARIRDTVQVLKACRRRAIDAGVKVAMENHAGDLHSLELVRLIEEAGKDYVGANMDSGNAAWTLEDPLHNLENLGPYVLTTSLRDAVAWESDNGVTVQWTAMGSGTIDWPRYFRRFAELCSAAPVHIETISGFNHELAIKQEEFWKAWPHGKPKGFDHFLAWAKRGQPRPPRQVPDNVDRQRADQEFQRADLEKSIRYCKEIGLGRKR